MRGAVAAAAGLRSRRRAIHPASANPANTSASAPSHQGADPSPVGFAALSVSATSGGARVGVPSANASEGSAAGRSGIGIEANGDIKGCPSLPTRDWVGGNVREHSLEAIWERAAALRFNRDRTLADLWGHCRTCYYAD